MKETDFQKALAAGLRAQGCWVQKWPDLARAVTKPFDLCMSYHYEFFPIECKLHVYSRTALLKPTDVVLAASDFAGRAHQLPRLREMWEKQQARPHLALGVAVAQPGQTLDRRAWLVPAFHLNAGETYLIRDMEARFPNDELVWVPAIGWTAPWLPKPGKED